MAVSWKKFNQKISELCMSRIKALWLFICAVMWEGAGEGRAILYICIFLSLVRFCCLHTTVWKVYFCGGGGQRGSRLGRDIRMKPFSLRGVDILVYRPISPLTKTGFTLQIGDHFFPILNFGFGHGGEGTKPDDNAGDLGRCGKKRTC